MKLRDGEIGRQSGEPGDPAGRRAAAAAVALVLAVTAAAAGCGGDAGPGRFVNLGTAGTGGIYYPLGGTIASLLSAADTVRQYNAEVTGGSLENVTRLRDGDIELGMSIGTTVHEAYSGGAGFDSAFSDLRVVAPLYPNQGHVLVPSGSEVGGVEDFEGSRLSVGSAGSGTEQFSVHLLAVHGLTYDDLDERFLSFAESAQGLADASIDGAVFSVGYPASAALQAISTADARLVAIDSARVRELRERHPYYEYGVIPADAYPGLERDVPTVAMMNWIVARAGVEDEVVRRLLNVLDARRQQLISTTDIARQIDLGRLTEAPIPVHPAAVEWAREKGVPGCCD